MHISIYQQYNNTYDLNSVFKSKEDSLLPDLKNTK